MLTPDDAAELVVPEGAFDEEITLPTTTVPPPTTTQPVTSSTEAPEATAVENDDAPVSASTTTEAEAAVTTSTTVAEASSTTLAATTTTTTTTTTTQPPKETIPIEEEEVNPGIKLMDSLDGFNACLASEGWSFIGIPSQFDPESDAGPEDPTNNPEYIQALIVCNSRTNIAEAFQEFQTSRSELDPDEIREQNEQTIRLGDCLRGKGWSVGELTPNEDGLLNPTEFQSPDGDIDTNEIRDCISELALTDEDG